MKIVQIVPLRMDGDGEEVRIYALTDTGRIFVYGSHHHLPWTWKWDEIERPLAITKCPSDKGAK